MPGIDGGPDIPERLLGIASEWLRRRDAREPGVEEGLRQWRAADPGNEAAFIAASRFWGRTDRAGEVPGIADIGLNKAPFYMRRDTHVALGCAGAVMVALLGSAVVMHQSGLPGFVTPARAAIYETAIGEIRTVALAGGTMVVLDTNTHVEMARAPEGYRIRVLQGRIRVTDHSAGRRFLLGSDDPDIEVVGESFDVSRDRDAPRGAGLRIAASRFPVQLFRDPAGEGEPVRLPVGSWLALDEGAAAATPLASQDRQWVSGMVALDATPLDEAITAMNRYNRVRIELGVADLGRRPVSGAFHADDPLAFARAVAAMFDLRLVRERHDTIILASR